VRSVLPPSVGGLRPEPRDPAAQLRLGRLPTRSGQLRPDPPPAPATGPPGRAPLRHRDGLGQRPDDRLPRGLRGAEGLRQGRRPGPPAPGPVGPLRPPPAQQQRSDVGTGAGTVAVTGEGPWKATFGWPSLAAPDTC